MKEAEGEFQETISYYDAVSRTIGDRFIAEIRAAIRDIRTYPEAGAPLSRQVRQRVLHSFKYSVLYVERDEVIVVIAVAPHRRRPWYWRHRLRKLPK